MLSRCASCASSMFECSWCIQMSRCVNMRRNCPSDAVVTGTAVRSFCVNLRRNCPSDAVVTGTAVRSFSHYRGLLVSGTCPFYTAFHCKYSASAANNKWQRHYVLGSYVRPSVCCPLTSVPCDAISLYLINGFSKTCHKYSPCDWASLKRFSRSEVKSKGYICTNM